MLQDQEECGEEQKPSLLPNSLNKASVFLLLGVSLDNLTYYPMYLTFQPLSQGLGFGWVAAIEENGKNWMEVSLKGRGWPSLDRQRFRLAENQMLSPPKLVLEGGQCVLPPFPLILTLGYPEYIKCHYTSEK